MYTRSSQYDAAFGQSHTVAYQVDVTDESGDVLYSTTGNPKRIDFIDGNVSATSDAIRRTGDLSLVGDLDHDMRRVLRDDGTRFVLYRGIQYMDGTRELGQLGVFCATEIDLDDTGQHKLHRITLADLSFLVSERSLTKAFSATGSPFDIVVTLLSQQYPQLKFAPQTAPLVNTSVTLSMNAKADPWQQALDLLASFGSEAYMDPFGLCVIRNIAQIDQGEHVWEFTDGEDCTYLNIQSTYLRKRWNHVIATSQTPSNGGLPMRADVVDDDVHSSSYYYGTYGDVPFFLDSMAVSTQAQLDKAAHAVWQKIKGKADSQTISCLPHVFFEIDDIIKFTRSNTEQSGYYIIDKLAIPLTYARPMYITMRRGRRSGT